ncbi:MAG: hypothetical protein ACPGO5_03355 [Patescibacteria group bacterium]
MNLRQFFVGTLTFVMSVTMSFGGFTANFANAAAGELIKSSSSSTVYVVNQDGVTLHLFPNAAIFDSWNYSFDNVTTVPDLSAYTMGAAAEARSGSLLKSFDKADTYYVADGTLYPIISETVFYALGLDFGDVFETSQAFVDQYPMGAMIDNADWHVKGQLIKYANDPAVFLIGDNNTYRAFQSESAFFANRLSFDTVLTIPDTEVYTPGALVTGFEHGISTPMGVPGGAVTPPPTGSNLTVSLDSSSPAAATVVVDSGATHAQALVPFITVRFSAPADGAVTVTSLRFKRTGISSDTDIQDTYLYEGMERVAFGGSLANNYVTFNNPNGLFTVPAGQSKAITLRIDLNEDASSGQTMAFQLESASDVTASSGAVSGSFPALGATMSTAQASDLGFAIIGGSYTTPSSNDTSIDSGEEDFELWKFTLTANDQDLHIKGLRFTKVGSVDTDDVQNFRLVQGGTELGTVAMMNNDFEVYFDLSNNPFAIDKGESRVFSLRGDLIGGSNRDFKFTFQYRDDLIIEDQSFGVLVPADLSSMDNEWSVVQPSGDYLIGTGSLSIQKAADSPTSQISAGATNLHMGRYEFEATGEDMKVKNLLIAAATSETNGGLDNCRILVDGVQVGSTTDCTEYSSTATVTLGSSFIAKAGQTHIVDLYADAKTSTSTNLQNAETVQVYLATGSSNAQGMQSLSTVNAPASDTAANSLTVSNASLTFSEYTAVGNQTLLAGANDVKIAAIQILSGSSEAVDVDGITITASSTEAGYLQNLKLMMDGQQIGTTKTSPSTSNLFSVNFNVAKGQAKVVELYADLKTTASGTIELGAEGSGTGSVTGNSVTASNVLLQDVTIGSGDLNISVDASSPEASLLVAPSTGQTVAKFKFDATSSDFWLHEFTLIASTSAIDSVSQVSVEYPTESGTATAIGNFGASGIVTFYIQDAPMYIEKDDDAVMTVKVDVASTSGSGGADNDDNLRVGFDVSGTFKAVDSAGTADTTGTSGGAVNEANDLLPNTHQIFKAYPTVAFTSDTPSGTLIPATNSLIAKVQITATGNDDVTFENGDGNTLTFQVSSNGAAAGAADDVITLKDDQGNTLWSTTTGLHENSEFTADFSTKSLEVGQGTSEVIFVYADTSELATSGENIQFWLDDTAGDIDWGINNSGSYNHGDIIFRGDLYGGALATP